MYENHGFEARVRESGEISPTVTARYGTGGGNTPLVQEDSDVYCIVGNIIDRQPEKRRQRLWVSDRSRVYF